METIKQYIRILLLLILPLHLLAQQKVITLSEPLPANGATVYEAQQTIYLNPPFSYTANGTNSFVARINESLATNTDYISSSTIGNRKLNTALSIGTINGNAGVGQTGAANYQMEITLPPGINGMQPAVSLVYNSQGGNGIAGWGFNIAGLSAVGRAPKTVYSDGAAVGMRMIPDAKYVLDGVSLIRVSGTNGTDGAEYRLENDNFARVYSRGSYNNTGPDWFEVKTKEGLIMKYGSTTGKLKGISGTSTYYAQAWYLNRMENQDGTGVDYTYEAAGMGLYIKKINYAGNAVEFFYDMRRDTIPVYLGSKTGLQDRILRKITVTCEGNLFRTYELEYAFDRYSRLSKITESNGNGEKKNPTVFEWGSFPAKTNISVKNVAVETSSLESDFSKQIYSSIDINGDGLTDIIGNFTYKKNGMDYNAFQIYIAKKDGDNIKFEVGDVDYNWIPSNCNFKRLKTNCGLFLTGDIFGEGIQAAILPAYSLFNNVSEVYFYIIRDGRYNIYASELVSSSELPEIAIGDVDNDGKSELLYIEKGKTNGVYVLKIGGDGKRPFTGYSLSITSKPERMLVEDFNGDGMMDVMVVTKEGYHIYWNQGGVFSNLFSSSDKSIGTVFNSDYSRIQIGDFNGDGLPDFVLNENNNDKWHLAINQGNGVFSKKALPQITVCEEDFTSINDDEDGCFVTDFDGDGKSDIIINDSDYDKNKVLGIHVGDDFKNHKVYWYRSTGNDFELVKSTTYNKKDAKSQYFVFGDFKGTGSSQMMFYGYDCYNGQDVTQKWRLYENTGLTAESGKIKGISDGLNNQTKFTYKPLSDPSIYTPATNTYPVVSLRGAMYAVSEMTQTNGVAGNIQNKYTYLNGRIHAQGKGFLGFEQIKTVESLANITQIQDYGKLDASYFFPVSSKATLLAGADTISTTISTIKAISLGGKRIFVHADSIIEKDFLNGVSNLKVQVFNNVGNMTKETVSYGNDVTEVKDMVYAHYGGNETANKLTTLTLTRTYAGEPAFTTKQTYGYDVKGHLLKETQYANTSNPLITEYSELNALGLPLKVKVSTTETTREGSFAYDNRGRVTSETNAIGQVFKTTYDKWGRVDTKTDHLKLNTVYAYDNWGRQILVTYPDNTNETLNMAWSGSGGDVPAGALYSSTSTATGKANIIIYYDAAGRELRTLSYNAFNKKIYSDNQYNTKGQLEKTSLPYFPGDTPQWITYAYRTDGRQESENNLGRITKYEYGKLTTTVTAPDGQKTTKTTNACGDVVEVEEINRGGLIQYIYHSSGQPREVTANGSIFTMEYDACGRQNKLTDPNAGAIKYNYNPFGELTAQEDARGYKSSFKYDKLGRETERTVSGKTYTSVYNAYGIDTVKVGDKALLYRYDSYGRLLSLTEKAGADSYTTSYTYNANGQVQTRTYPSGFAVQYSYTNGMTTAIKKASNQAAIWELTAENALGQITSYRKGGKFNIELGYDAYFNPVSKKLKENDIIYASRSINPQTGNLNNRSVNYGTGTRTETFGYDSQNRLTKWYSNTNNINQATYSNNGNIETKTGIGTYNYGSPRPHAVTGVAEKIAMQNQDITYNEAGRATSIEEGNYRLALEYGVDNRRIKTFLYENGTLIKEKHFSSGYEKVITGQTVRELHYITAPSGLTALVIRSAGTDSLFHVYTDHQGSILQLTNEAGTVVEQRSYDPWGRERNPDNWNSFALNSEYRRTDRGYTGHEHLPEFGLINMNARLYDPMLGRFLSPDPYVQSPDFTQSYNRYAYCLNNPLLYTDPSGEYALIDDLIAAVVGGIVNVVVNAVQGNIHSWGQGFSYFGVGAAGTWAGLYAGPLASGAIIGAGNSFVTQGFGSTGNWNWNNIHYDQVAMSGLMGAGMSYIGSQVSGFISPYTSKLFSGIGGQAVQQSLTQGITGSATGFTMSTGLALLNGESWNDALKEGGKGAALGFGIGFSNGLATGMREAYKVGENPWTGKDLTAKPTQNHHFATDKNKKFTPQMKAIASKYGLDLNEDWNKQALPHQGRHPNDYHRWVLREMRTIDAMPNMNQQQFIQLFDLNVRQPVINNPNMLYKNYWK